MKYNPPMVLFRSPWITLLILSSIFNLGVARVFDGDTHLISSEFAMNSASANHTEPALLELGTEDCYYAPEVLNGLMCDKEGYFVHSFENYVWWDPGQLSSWQWVKVPSSRALCCRPKISSFPAHPKLGGIETAGEPIGVVSVGCHTSTNKGLEKMQCEAEGSSFVTGFLDSRNLQKSPNTYYPVDGIECCTPVMLMSSGDAWSIERCDCTSETKSISCQAQSTASMLWGFEYTGETDSHTIPLAPAKCCKLCWGEHLYSLDDCNDLNQCSGNGVCMLGSCMCKPGFTGADCSISFDPKGSHRPWYKSIWWLGIIGFALANGGFFLTLWYRHRSNLGYQARLLSEHQTPLLDPEGSAGSVDTHSDASSFSLVLTVPHVETEGQPGDGDEMGNGTPISTSHENEPEREDSDAPQLRNQAQTTSSEPQVLESSDESDSDAPAPDQMNEREPHMQSSAGMDDVDKDCPQVDANGLAQSSSASHTEEKPDEKQSLAPHTDPGVNALKGMVCSICFERPIQVALVPCGHSNLCRRCSRKLEHCPFCRKKIVRRQKLFITG